ncbi:MAG: hypothetical protein H6573_28025 [Lewinellaceae bacterium]|nr:hypothetical protein [Lewinellaceae bacterium]
MEFNDGLIPSKSIDVLNLTLNSIIVKAVRLVDEPIEVLMSDYDIPETDIFSLAPGPLLLYLSNGGIVGLNSIPQLCSLLVWLERSTDGQCNPYTDLLADPLVFPVQMNHSDFSSEIFHDFTGRKIIGWKVFQEAPRTARFQDLPRESAVCLVMEGGRELFFVHGLHDNSDDFAVIQWEGILPEFKNKLVPVKISNS